VKQGPKIGHFKKIMYFSIFNFYKILQLYSFFHFFFRIFILFNFYVPSSAVFYQKKGVCAVLLVVYKCFYYNRN